MIIYFFLVCSGFIAFVSGRKHTLNMLLSMEFIMLGLLFGLVIFYSYIESESFFVLYFLTFVACEGALGLSIIVALIRTHGVEFFNMVNIIQC